MVCLNITYNLIKGCSTNFTWSTLEYTAPHISTFLTSSFKKQKQPKLIQIIFLLFPWTCENNFNISVNPLAPHHIETS